VDVVVVIMQSTTHRRVDGYTMRISDCESQTVQ